MCAGAMWEWECHRQVLQGMSKLVEAMGGLSGEVGILWRLEVGKKILWAGVCYGTQGGWDC